MSGIRDHCIYEFDCEWDYTYYQRDADGDVVGNQRYQAHAKKTVRIIYNKYNPEVARAAVQARFMFSDVVEGSLRIAEPRQLEIDAFIEEHIW
jgi:hypothetical protein